MIVITVQSHIHSEPRLERIRPEQPAIVAKAIPTTWPVSDWMPVNKGTTQP